MKDMAFIKYILKPLFGAYLKYSSFIDCGVLSLNSKELNTNIWRQT